MPDTDSEEILEPEPEGLGGWLILVAIGLALSPLSMLTALWRDILPVFLQGYWPVLTNPSSDAYHALWAPYLIFALVGNIAFVCLSFFCLFLFLRRSPRFPSVMIAYYVATVGLVATDLLLGHFIPAVSAGGEGESLQQLGRSIVACAIWIPYMRKSRRVSNTFLERRSPLSESSASALPAA